MMAHTFAKASAAIIGLAVATQACAAGSGKTAPAKTSPAPAKAGPSPAAAADLATPRPGSLAEQYCLAIRDAAAEARFAFQAGELKALEKELDDRLAKIEARSEELKEWFAKREAFSRTASEQLVSIYSAMRPESASEQLGKMDESIAAAIISKLEPRAASAILNDMPPEKAARLATILTGASRKSDGGDKS